MEPVHGTGNISDRAAAGGHPVEPDARRGGVVVAHAGRPMPVGLDPARVPVGEQVVQAAAEVDDVMDELPRPGRAVVGWTDDGPYVMHYAEAQELSAEADTWVGCWWDEEAEVWRAPPGWFVHVHDLVHPDFSSVYIGNTVQRWAPLPGER